MNGREKLQAKMGQNIRESMSGSSLDVPPIVPSGGGVVGDSAKSRGTSRTREAMIIQLDRLAPDPEQPRKEFDPEAMNDLANSLKERGQLQAIRVRWDAEADRWIVVTGERRYRAAVLAGLPSLLCVDAARNQSSEELLEDQLVENCLRSDLKPVEQARAFRKLMASKGLSIRQLAQTLRISSASIGKALAILELPLEVQDLVETGRLSPSTAYEVSKVDGARAQTALAEEIVAGRVKRDDVTNLARSTGRKATGKSRRPTRKILKAGGGTTVTLENTKGLTDTEILRALQVVLSQFTRVDFDAA